MTRNKIAVVGVLVIAGMAAFLVFQHQSLLALRQENEALRQQADQSAQLSAENARLSNSATQANNSLAEEQQRELLRLRGEVGVLRAQTKELENLKKENQRLQAFVPHPSGGAPDQEADPAKEQFRQAAVAKMHDARSLTLGLLLYNNDYTNQFVTRLDQLAPYLDTNQLSGSNEFELVYSGFLRDLTNPARTIVIQEKQAWQGPDGSMFKAYGFADGHSEVHKSQDGSFDAWEKERTVATPATPH
jgi:hypothetical protein